MLSALITTLASSNASDFPNSAAKVMLFFLYSAFFSSFSVNRSFFLVDFYNPCYTIYIDIYLKYYCRTLSQFDIYVFELCPY